MKIDELDQLAVHTETKDITLSQLREMVDENDILTNPDYQRNYVYDDKRASLLVESILIGIPIPVIYLCEENEGIYSVMDAIKQVLGEEAFFFHGERASKFNGAVYDSIVIPFSLFPKRVLLQHADEIREGIFDMKENDAEYRENVYVGTNAGRRVRSRITKVIGIINKCIDPREMNMPRCFDESIRQKLFQCNPVCAICGNKILTIDDCEVDHIIPFAKGGLTSIENAQLTHRTCNRRKSAHAWKDDFGVSALCMY